MSDEEGTNERAFIRYLISNIRCPVCHHRYSPDDILVIDHKDELWFMGIACPHCETQGLVLVIDQSQQSKEALPTDLAPEEEAWFVQRGPITTDDVLDFHEFLRDYRGSLAELLNDEP